MDIFVDIADYTQDVCKHCGNKIYYSADDGYWDSFWKLEGDVIHYTSQCYPDKEESTWHNPVNYVMEENSKGYKPK
jgi:hypothetical protein